MRKLSRKSINKNHSVQGYASYCSCSSVCNCGNCSGCKFMDTKEYKPSQGYSEYSGNVSVYNSSKSYWENDTKVYDSVFNNGGK